VNKGCPGIPFTRQCPGTSGSRLASGKEGPPLKALVTRGIGISEPSAGVVS
jgi:hypothetical protein